jgi:hypothetical protein
MKKPANPARIYDFTVTGSFVIHEKLEELWHPLNYLG